MSKKSKKTKQTFKVYAAWDFDKEAEEYNQMSEKGWQLVNGGCFSQKYEFDDSVVYCYQIDFNNKIEDIVRYDDMFREMGWERINSTFNGWHIFRKKYDPSLPDEEYEIYTDTQSRNEMLKRWRNFSVLMAAAVALTAIGPLSQVFNVYNAVGSVAVIAIYLLMAIMLISAFIGINNLINNKKNKHRFNYNLFLFILILSAIIFFVSAFVEPENFYYLLGVLIGVVMVITIVGIKALFNRNTNKK
ncbi:MAG: DUF2812 domain-containing protein [Acutalibacteraceae bacterium]